MQNSQDPTIRMLRRKTGLVLTPLDGPQLFLCPARDADGELQYGKLTVMYEQNQVIFSLQEDLLPRDQRPADRTAPVQNWIEMTIGYGPEQGFRRARLMRSGGVDLLSNGAPAATDPHGMRSQGVPLRVTSVYDRIKQIGFTNSIRPKKK